MHAVLPLQLLHCAPLASGLSFTFLSAFVAPSSGQKGDGGGGTSRSNHPKRLSRQAALSCAFSDQSYEIQLQLAVEKAEALRCIHAANSLTSEWSRTFKPAKNAFYVNLIVSAIHSGSFAWCQDASPCSYARLCRAGFLPIAESFTYASSEGNSP